MSGYYCTVVSLISSQLPGQLASLACFRLGWVVRQFSGRMLLFGARKNWGFARSANFRELLPDILILNHFFESQKHLINWSPLENMDHFLTIYRRQTNKSWVICKLCIANTLTTETSAWTRSYITSYLCMYLCMNIYNIYTYIYTRADYLKSCHFVLLLVRGWLRLAMLPYGFLQCCTCHCKVGVTWMLVSAHTALLL